VVVFARLPRRDIAGGEAVALVLEGFRQRGDVAAQAGEMVEPRKTARLYLALSTRNSRRVIRMIGPIVGR